MKPDFTAAHATIDLLAATWPACFATKPDERRPLAVGIGQEITAATEGAITSEELNATLRLYVGHKRYQRALKEGAQRVDLEGYPAGAVTAEQAAKARQRIEEMEARLRKDEGNRPVEGEPAKGAAREGRASPAGSRGRAAVGGRAQAGVAAAPVSGGVGHAVGGHTA
jgi:sRNA-binding protein